LVAEEGLESRDGRLNDVEIATQHSARASKAEPPPLVAVVNSRRSSARWNWWDYCEVRKVLGAQPKGGGIFVRVRVLLRLGRPPDIEACRTAEHHPDPDNGRFAAHLDLA
jgi:hypothetical protein